jgi:hypothetical protein
VASDRNYEVFVVALAYRRRAAAGSLGAPPCRIATFLLVLQAVAVALVYQTGCLPVVDTGLRFVEWLFVGGGGSVGVSRSIWLQRVPVIFCGLHEEVEGGVVEHYGSKGMFVVCMDLHFL